MESPVSNILVVTVSAFQLRIRCGLRIEGRIEFILATALLSGWSTLGVCWYDPPSVEAFIKSEIDNPQSAIEMPHASQKTLSVATEGTLFLLLKNLIRL
jgi:hypothetical protein